MKFLKPSLHVLQRFSGNRELNLKILLSKTLDKFPPDIRNEVTRTVYGITRNEKLIEMISAGYCKKKISSSDRPTRILLNMGVYLISFSGSYPGYAVVNEIVKIAPSHSRGFLNAVLRKISENREEIAASMNRVTDPTVRHSVSRYFYDHLSGLVGDTEAALSYLDSEPKFHLRTNRGEKGLERAREFFDESGIPCRFLENISSFEITKAGKTVSGLFPGNEFYFQNSGSFAVSAITSAFARSMLLDGCAAPGTKSLTISTLSPGVRIFASDLNFRRMSMILPFLKKSAHSNINVLTADINQPAFRNRFDTILIDAPCTSSGTIRKNPDLKTKIDSRMAERNSLVQKEILNSVMQFSGKDSRLIYSVCSFIKDETDDVIEDCISRNPGFRFEIQESAEQLSRYGFRTKMGNYGVYLLPDDELNNDLFYISVLQKK